MTLQPNPTIMDKDDFDPTSACKLLFKALEGIGTDESVIVRLIASCSNKQRQQIKAEYFNLYKKDLLKEFKSELKIRLSFDFKQLLLSLFMTSAEHDAYRLKRSVKGIGTDEKTLVDVLLTTPSQQLKDAKTLYLKMFGSSLECDVADDTSGNFRKFVFPLSQVLRKSNNTVNREKAKTTAEMIDFTFTEYKGTDTPRFDFIGLCNRESFQQMKATFEEYEKLTGRTIIDFIEKEFHGDTSSGLKSAVKCSASVSGFLAERLSKSLDRIPRNDDAIIRIIVSRSEIDLDDIKREFELLQGKSLEEKIKQQTSGLFKQLLLAIVRGNLHE